MRNKASLGGPPSDRPGWRPPARRSPDHSTRVRHSKNFQVKSPVETLNLTQLDDQAHQSIGNLILRNLSRRVFPSKIDIFRDISLLSRFDRVVFKNR